MKDTMHLGKFKSFPTELQPRRIVNMLEDLRRQRTIANISVTRFAMRSMFGVQFMKVRHVSFQPKAQINVVDYLDGAAKKHRRVGEVALFKN